MGELKIESGLPPILGVLKRAITKKECSWLPINGEFLPAGTVVYKWRSHCYGCITPSGVTVSFRHDVAPFFEVPASAVEWQHDHT